MKLNLNELSINENLCFDIYFSERAGCIKLLLLFLPFVESIDIACRKLVLISKVV